MAGVIEQYMGGQTAAEPRVNLGPSDIAEAPVQKKRRKFTEFTKELGLNYEALRREEREKVRKDWISTLPDDFVAEVGGPQELEAAVLRKFPEHLEDQMADAMQKPPKPYVEDIRTPAVYRSAVQYDKLRPDVQDESEYAFKTGVNPGVDLNQEPQKPQKFSEWLKSTGTKYSEDMDEIERAIVRDEWISSLPIERIDEVGGEQELHAAINRKYGFGDTIDSLRGVPQVDPERRSRGIKRDEAIARVKERREQSSFVRGMKATPSGTGQILSTPGMRTEAAARMAMEQAEVGDKAGFKVGSFAGPIVKDTPTMIGAALAGGPAGMGTVVGLQGAGRELGRQAERGEDPDYLRAAGMGAAEGLGAGLSARLGDAARAKALLSFKNSRIVDSAAKRAVMAGIAEGAVDSTADAVVTNATRVGINLASGEESDRDVDFLRDFMTNAIGFTGISVAKNLPAAAIKGADRGTGTAIRAFKTLIDTPSQLKKMLDADYTAQKTAGAARSKAKKIADLEAAEIDSAKFLTAEQLAQKGYRVADKARAAELERIRKPVAQGADDIVVKPTPPDVLPLDESLSKYASKRVMVETIDAEGKPVKMYKDLRLETPGPEMRDAGVADAVYNRMVAEKEAAKTASWISHMMKRPTAVLKSLPEAMRKGWQSQPETRSAANALMQALINRRHYVSSKVMAWYPRKKGDLYNNESAISFLAADDAMASGSAKIQEKQMRVLKDVGDTERMAKSHRAVSATGQTYNAWDLGIQVATMLRKLAISKKIHGDYEHASMGSLTGRDMLIAMNTWKADPELQKIWPAVDNVLELVDKNAREIRQLYVDNGMIDQARAYDMEQLGIWMPFDYKNTRPGEVRLNAELDEANFGTVGYKPNTDIERVKDATDLVPDMDYKNTIVNAWYDAIEKVNRNNALRALEAVVHDVSSMVKRAGLDTDKISRVKGYLEASDPVRAAKEGTKAAAAESSAKVAEIRKFTEVEIRRRHERVEFLKKKIEALDPEDKTLPRLKAELIKAEKEVRAGVNKIRKMKKDLTKEGHKVKAAADAERLIAANDIDSLRKLVDVEERRLSGIERERKVSAFSRSRDERRGLTQKMTYTKADGTEAHFYVTKKFKTEFEAAEPKTLNTVMKWLSTVSGTRILRATATAQNLAFTATNLARDVMYNAFVDSSGIISEKTAVGFGSLVRPIARMLLRDVRETSFGKVNTSVAGLVKMWLTNPKQFKEISDSFVAHGGARFGSLRDASAGSYFKDSHNLKRGLMDRMEYLIEGSERITRMAMYLKAQEKLPQIFKKKLETGEWTKLEYDRAISKRDELAAWSSARVIDFTQGGNVTRLMSSMIPYLNASVQGSRGLIRAMLENPDLMVWKMADFGALVTALAVYNIMTGEDDKFTAQQKRSGLYIVLPGFGYYDDVNDTWIPRAITIPIPQELMAYKAFIEAVANGVINGHEEKDVDSVLESIEATIPGGLPPAVNAYLAMTGYDTFMKRELGDAGYQTPGLRYDKNTHVFYRALGEVAPDLIDPRKIQRAVNAYVAESNFAYRGIHAMIDAAGKEAYPHNIDTAGNLVKSLGVGRFVMAGRPDIVAKEQIRGDFQRKQKIFDNARHRARSMVTKVISGEISRQDAVANLKMEFEDRAERAKAIDMFYSGMARERRSQDEIEDVIDKDIDGDEYSENSEE